MDEKCVFCKIAEGTIPATKLYEDDLVLAFLDIAPINFGHALVIPKAHYQGSSGVPEEVGGRLFRVGARLGTAMKRALDVDGFNLHLADGACAGQVVFHAHLHVVPRAQDDHFHWNWRSLKYESDARRDEVAAAIVAKLQVP